MNTSNTEYSPWQLLPAPEPRTVSPPPDYFYHNVAKHLVKDTVRICHNGLGIDLNEVDNLESTIDESIAKVQESLQSNPIILKYFEERHKQLIDKYIAERQSHLKPISDFIKPFKPSDMVHRSYFMYLFANSQGFSQPSELLPSGIPKWPANLVKKLSSSYPVLKRLLEGTLNESHPLVVEAMNLLATHKADLYNSKYLTQCKSPDVPIPTFNPRSPDAKHLVFTEICGYESGKLTDGYKKYEREYDKAIRYGKPLPSEPKNKWSWGRKQLEALLDSVSDLTEHALFTDMIEFSYGDKIKSSFIPAFYKYTVDNRLYSNLNLLGAKSARFTSSNPNMLQLPSTGSIYAKPIKKCFVAAPGNVILTADFSALEDRVLASITNDATKCAILEDGIDGHSLGACTYYPTEVAKHIPITDNLIEDSKIFEQAVAAGNKVLKDLRQASKAVTFKLA